MRRGGEGRIERQRKMKVERGARGKEREKVVITEEIFDLHCEEKFHFSLMQIFNNNNPLLVFIY